MGRSKSKPTSNSRNGNQRGGGGNQVARNEAAKAARADTKRNGRTNKSLPPSNTQFLGPLLLCLVLLCGFYNSWVSRNSFGPAWENNSGKRTTFADWANRVVEYTRSSDSLSSSSPMAPKRAQQQQQQQQQQQRQQQQQTRYGTDENNNDASLSSSFLSQEVAGKDGGPGEMDMELLYKEATEAITQTLMEKDPSLSINDAEKRAREFLRNANLVFAEQKPMGADNDNDENNENDDENNENDHPERFLGNANNNKDPFLASYDDDNEL